MKMNDYLEVSVKFELEDVDGLSRYDATFPDDVSWVKLVTKFADFLTMQYGYPIKDRLVFLTDYPHITNQDSEVNHITSSEYAMILKNRDRSDLFSEWGDEE